MKRKIYFCLLIAFWALSPSAQAGTKEEIVRLQSDVLGLQNQFRELQKTFSESTEGLKSLVVQLNDQVAKSNILLGSVSKSLENQASGANSADQTLLQEIRTLSGKLDDIATRISALAQQLNDLRVQSKSLTQAGAPGGSLSPETMYSQAFNDFVQGNLDLAIPEFTAYVSNYPGGDKAATALLNIGDAYLNQNKLPQAISSFTRVINDYPSSDSVASALYKRAKAELQMQEIDNAVADFRSIVEKYPATQEAEQAKAELQKLGLSPTKPAKEQPRRKSR
jgi:tol-pal system protein YbgF